MFLQVARAAPLACLYCMVSLRPCPGIPGRSRLPASSWVLCASHNAACLCWPSRCNLLCVYLSARCGAAGGASRCIPWACACCSERPAYHERWLSHITNGGYLIDRLPGLCTCICLLGVGLPLVALCVALCAIPAMPGSSPTERHGGRLVRLVLLPAGFLPYRGVFLTHERATGSERKPPKVSESGGYAGLRPARVCVRPPACPSACAAVRT